MHRRWRARRCAADAPAAGEPEGRARAVTDPYIELRTGPGRGYPIFFVAARGEWIDDRAAPHRLVPRPHRRRQGRLGASRASSRPRSPPPGQQKSFRDILLDDYLSRKVQLGAAWGQFKSEPMLKLWTSYRLSDTLSIEATLGQVQGVFSGTDFWHVNLLAEPWTDQRLSPFFGVVPASRFRDLQPTGRSNQRGDRRCRNAARFRHPAARHPC